MAVRGDQRSSETDARKVLRDHGKLLVIGFCWQTNCRPAVSANGRPSKDVHVFGLPPADGLLAAVRPRDFGTSRSQLYPELTLSLRMLRRGAVPDLPRVLSFGFDQMQWSDFRRSWCSA